MKKIKINDSICIGCGACFGGYPEHVEMNDEGYAKVIDGKNEVEDDLAEEIIGVCPVGAISEEE